MSKISAERMEKYRKLGNMPSMDMVDPKARSIFQRMEAEGVTVKEMRNESLGMFMAP